MWKVFMEWARSVYETKRIHFKSQSIYIKNYNKKTPKILASEYKLEYKFDVESFWIITKEYLPTPPWKDLPVSIKTNSTLCYWS